MGNGFQFKRWPTEYRVITQHFGARPLFYARFGLPGHEGIDLRATVGSKIYAVAAGTIAAVRRDLSHPYGNHVRLQHADGYMTVYAHLQEARVVPGQRVRSGQILGLAGATGNVQGAHLHLTLKHPGGDQHHYPYNIIDPTPFLMPLIDRAWLDAKYEGDTIADGTVFVGGARFVQSWQLRNSGGIAWTTAHRLARVRGEAMGSPESVSLPTLQPGASGSVSVDFVAPEEPGHYVSVWQPTDVDDVRFGDPVWVEIEVPDPTATRPPTPISDLFVQPLGMGFTVRGQPFRFLGVNLRGLAHYGRRRSDPLQHSQTGHRDSQLRAVYEMGARVVRLFLPDKDATPGEIEERLRELLQIVKRDFPDLYLLPAFTNLYNDVPFFVPGDEGFFTNVGGKDLLNRDFFAEGYRSNYLPFVERIVGAFASEPNIFAWEIGNELKLDRADHGDANDPNPRLFVNFNLEVAKAIKRLDSNHMVTTGMKSTQHAWLNTHDLGTELQDALYASHNIDFITIHSYEGEREQIGDRAVWDDIKVAVRHSKPFVVEEAGFDVRVFSDRRAKYREHLDKWLGQNASGYMPWGFIHTAEIGDGDREVGFGVNHPDFQALYDLFKFYAQRLLPAAQGFARALAPMQAALAMPAPTPMQVALPVPSGVGKAGFDFEGYTRMYLEASGSDAVNDATGYGVGVQPAEVAVGERYWTVIGIHHLSPEENRRRHHAYVQALDENGQRVQAPKPVIGWDYQFSQSTPDPKTLDKPDDEPATDVPLEKNTTVHLWVQGDGPSDRVTGLHIRHGDEDDAAGNAWGQHSFYIVFQRTVKQAAGVLVDGGNGVVVTPPALPAVPMQPAVPVMHLPPVLPSRVPAMPVVDRYEPVAAIEKIGIDANAPISEQTGAISPHVVEPDLIADLAPGWVRINFIVGRNWQGPSDPSWQALYRRILDNYVNRGIKIYGLISDQAVHRHPQGRFRQPPQGDPLRDDWVQEYVRNFMTIIRTFRNQLSAVESFNEPDDWKKTAVPGFGERTKNYVHPGWFAAMLEAIYNAVRSDLSLTHIPLVSGPLQGLRDGNGARDYLTRTYKEGVDRLGWGRNGKPYPFDGVGYHLYVHEEYTDNMARQRQHIERTYRRYLDEMKEVVRSHEQVDKPFYISEMGWFTNGSNREAMQRFQADSLKIGLDWMIREPDVALAINFCTQDFGQPGDLKYYGMYDNGGLSPRNRKPAYQAFKELCASAVGRSAKRLRAGSAAPVVTQPVLTDNASYVVDSDLVKDNSQIGAGATFVQRWRLRNTGTRSWTNEYKLVWIGGGNDRLMGAPTSVPVQACDPGNVVDLQVTYVAPTEPGTHTSTWRLFSPHTGLFGEPVWTQIFVPALPVAVPAPGELARAAALYAAPLPPQPDLVSPPAMAPSPTLPTPIPVTAGQPIVIYFVIQGGGE